MTSSSHQWRSHDRMKYARSNRLDGLTGRLLTVSIAIPLSLILLSSYHLRILFGLCLSTLGGFELQTNFERHIHSTVSVYGRLSCTIPSSSLLIITALYGRAGFAHALFLMPFAISCFVVVSNLGKNPVQSDVYNRYLFALFQCFYLGSTLAHASFLNDLPYALDALLYTIIITCIGEAFGLFGGTIFGSHHITSISPGKTLEGYISTIIASIAASYCFDVIHSILHPMSLFPLHGFQLHLLSIVIALVASIGDLVESLVKRGFKIKDMGDVLPGMGGLLDRIDALLFAFPTTYYYLVLSGHITTPC